MRTLYAPAAIVAGGCQTLLNVRACPALNDWLSNHSWCTFAPDAEYTSMSIKRAPAAAAETDALIVALAPAFVDGAVALVV